MGEVRPFRERKIGSIGLHVSRGVTMHGFAVNVDGDLQPFEWIVPCAIDHVRMTSVGREIGREADMHAFSIALTTRLSEALERRPIERTLAELGAVTA